MFYYFFHFIPFVADFFNSFGLTRPWIIWSSVILGVILIVLSVWSMDQEVSPEIRGGPGVFFFYVGMFFLILSWPIMIVVTMVFLLVTLFLFLVSCFTPNGKDHIGKPEKLI